MRVNLSTLVEFVGLLLVVVASFAVDWRLGAAFIGVVLVAVGYVLDGPSGGDEGQ